MRRDSPFHSAGLVLLAFTAPAACQSPDAVTCDFGIVCPQGFICEPVNETCIQPGQPVCGDGEREGDEACDDGPANSDTEPDRCRTDCTAPTCGDGQRDNGEACDDGNREGGDGCSEDCDSTEFCGNGVVDFAVGEGCDDGNRRSADGCSSSCTPEIVAWGRTAPAPRLPTPMYGALGFDEARERVVSFSGRVQCADGPMSCPRLSPDTLEFDGEWDRDDRPGPPPREVATMAWDRTRQRLVLFGGRGERGRPLGDTWTYGAEGWTEVALEGAPPARYGATMAWDPNLNGLLLVAGRDMGGMLADTWLFDEDGWRMLEAEAAPGPRFGAAMGFDGSTSQMVLHGGADDASTWVFDGSTWRTVSPGTTPPARRYATLVPDGFGLTLFGGQISTMDGPDLTEDAFRFKDGTWQRLEEAELFERAGHGAVWVDLLGTIFLFGGTCCYDPERPMPCGELECFLDPAFAITWDQPRPTDFLPGADTFSVEGLPYARFAESPRGDALRFGGIVWDDPLLVSDETWIIEAPEEPSEAPVWRRARVSDGPSARHSTALAWDDARGRFILFGGDASIGEPLADTWSFDGSAWTRLEPAQSPPARSGSAMVFDSISGEILMYGGYGPGLQVYADLWAFDGATWRALASNAPPGPLTDHTMAFDPLRGTTLIQARPSENGSEATWEYSTGAWRAVSRRLPRVVDEDGELQTIQDAVIDWDGLRARPMLLNFYLSDRCGCPFPPPADQYFCADPCVSLAVAYLGEAGWSTLPAYAPPAPERVITGAARLQAGRRAVAYSGGSGHTLRFVNSEPEERCDEEGDEDGDGLSDCSDPDCRGVAGCPMERCADPQADMNEDGRSGCDDPTCGGAVCDFARRCIAGECRCEPDQTEGVCWDGRDGDCDGLADCDDPDCALDPQCAVADCADADGDGYGVGAACDGPDCNDSDAACQAGACCPACEDDPDRDGYGIGPGCAGRDCAPMDPYCAAQGSPCCTTSGAGCVDPDGDGAGLLACERFDCNELDVSCADLGDPCCAADRELGCEGCGCAGVADCLISCLQAEDRDDCAVACLARADREALEILAEVTTCAVEAGCPTDAGYDICALANCAAAERCWSDAH